MTTLKNVLLLNAITSGATGIALAVMPRFFADVFEVNDTAPFVGVGIFLSVYAIVVWLVSRPQTVNLKSVNGVILADSLWVATSLVLIALQPYQVSLMGNLMIAAVALWVLLMAYLQYRAAKALQMV